MINNYEAQPSNSRFGTFFSSIFAAACVYSIAEGKDSIIIITFGSFSAILGTITALCPSILAPLNRLWFGLGITLGKVVTPITLGAIFFLIITPTAIITRLFGRDELKLNRRITNTYWTDRDPAGPSPRSFKKQY